MYLKVIGRDREIIILGPFKQIEYGPRALKLNIHDMRKIGNHICTAPLTEETRESGEKVQWIKLYEESMTSRRDAKHVFSDTDVDILDEHGRVMDTLCGPFQIREK